MRLAVTADVHLRKRDEHPERYNALEYILARLETEGIADLAIAGDLFDKDVSNHAEFEDLCRRHTRVHLHIIPGNHDPLISDKSIVGDNITIYTEPAVVAFADTAVLFLPYHEKQAMGEGIGLKEAELEGKRWVLVAHGDYCGGSKEFNEYEPGSYMPLSRSVVERYGPHAVLLGHIHKPLGWGSVYYAGSPCGLDIGETGHRRLLVYDTDGGSVTAVGVATDVLYFEESFVVVPAPDEAAILEKQIAGRIEAWGLAPADREKVRVRVRASGYAMDRGAIEGRLRQGFEEFGYYKDEGPGIDGLSASADPQRNAIAERVIARIEKLQWPFGDDEPAREQVVLEALKLVYGEGGA
jgi:DNA repair exonuclease SbcCD nuclease subunit